VKNISFLDCHHFCGILFQHHLNRLALPPWASPRHLNDPPLQQFQMEVALATGSAAVVSACLAALHDSPELTSAVKSVRQRLRSLLVPNAPEEKLRAALRGLPIALDAERRR
jgi:hypothetical protein